MAKEFIRPMEVTLFEDLSIDKMNPNNDNLYEYTYNTFTASKMKKLIKDNEKLLIGLTEDEKELLNRLIKGCAKTHKDEERFCVYAFAEHDCGDEEPEPGKPVRYYTTLWNPKRNKGDITAVGIVYWGEIAYQL